jgi:polyferredoxin
LDLIRLRRISQCVFLALFLLLLFWGTGPSPFLRTDPLAALLNGLSTRALYRGLLWSLAILIPTLFLGRFFCGWICPLGTLNHFFGNLRSERKRGRALLESNRYKPWQKLKYYILIAGLAAALLGSGILGLLDPISLAIRSFTLAVFPGLNYAFERTAHIGLFSLKQPHFRQALLMAAVLLTVLALNLRVTRFWCRALCPLGALLGAASRWSLLRLEKDGARCGDCNRCLLHCQGGDDPVPGSRWRKSECHLCLNCVGDCPEAGLVFRFRLAAPGHESAASPELSRRRALTGLAAGAALVPLARIGAAPIDHRDRLVRPPGSLDETAFLARCIRCGQCMKVCPSNAIHPALLEAGIEALWTPLVVPRIGYCQPSCVLCGQACPTGAIWEFTAREKGWRGEGDAPGSKPIRIGTAFYDRGRCLPWAMATDCIVCQEWCPTSPKAIYLREAEVTGAAGDLKKLRQPYIDPELCVGCGACEYACPVADRAAVSVTSVGESRSRANQFLLRKAALTKAALPALPASGEALGWEKTGVSRTFDAANLWKYLDGGADQYVNAGLAATLTAPYRFRAGFDAVADLHVFAGSAGAARIFDSEPAAGGTPVSIGDAARLYSASLVFRKGRYLVRLVAYSQGPEVPAALTALARSIDSKLPY